MQWKKYDRHKLSFFMIASLTVYKILNMKSEANSNLSVKHSID